MTDDEMRAEVLAVAAAIERGDADAAQRVMLPAGLIGTGTNRTAA